MTAKTWLVPAVAALLLVGCSTTPKSTDTSSSFPSTQVTSAAAPQSGTVKMTIKDFKYSPATVTVKKGTKIEVTNEDVAGHTLTADDGSFDTPVIGKGQTQTVTMDKVGTIKVHCKPHPSITGTITVVE